MGASRRQAAAIADVLVPDAGTPLTRLDAAIRVELLVCALEDAAEPLTLPDLLAVLDRIAAGGVADQLVAVVRDLVKREPNLLLADLAGRAL